MHNARDTEARDNEGLQATLAGAISCLGILYAPATGGGSVIGAGFGGGALGNIAQQYADGNRNNFNYVSLARDTTASGISSLVPIPGLKTLLGLLRVEIVWLQ